MLRRSLLSLAAFAMLLSGCRDARVEKQSQAWERANRKYCQNLITVEVPQRIDKHLEQAERILRAKEGWGKEEDAPAEQCRAARKHVQDAHFELGKLAGVADTLWFSMPGEPDEHDRDHLFPGHQMGLQSVKDLVIAFDTCQADTLAPLADQVASSRKGVANKLDRATKRCRSKFPAE